MPSSEYHHLIQQFHFYHQHQADWEDFQKLQFLNQLEEEACHFFLVVEKKRREITENGEKIKLLQEELHQIACFIDQLFQLFIDLDKNREQEIFEEEKAKIIEHFLMLGSSRMKILIEENCLKIFKPDDQVGNNFKRAGNAPMEEFGFSNRGQASIRAVASYLVSQELNLNFVPHTTVVTYKGERGSLQEWIKGIPLIEKKLEKLSDIFLSRLIKDHTLPELREAVARDATGREFWNSSEYGLILKPPLRHEKGNLHVFKNSIPISDTKAQVFFMMRKIELAEKKVTRIINPDFSLPTLQKGFLDAQAFDFIVGQVDRHIGNILIKDQEVLFLLDHDYTFPEKFKELDEVTKKALALRSALTELPPLLDKKTAHHIMNFQVEKFYEQFLSLGLTHEELESCKSRLALLKKHIHQLSCDKKIIDVWTYETYQKLIRGRKNEEGLLIHNNYISKFLEEQRQRQFILSLIQKKEKEWKASVAAQRSMV
ncbi:MAG: hypothetical protein FJ390_04950 [Verrucomicrobia bacterium]|nr:hypothetical protein [Verrucomicrobiota bacterium]